MQIHDVESFEAEQLQELGQGYFSKLPNCWARYELGVTVV